MTKEGKPAVVIDTNLFISAFIGKGNTPPHTLLTAWRAQKFSLIMSDDLIAEVAGVLRREKIYKRYHIALSEVDEFLNELRNSTEFVTPTKPEALPIHSRDRKDDIMFACALAGECDYLITGDNDLLTLSGDQALGKLQIITAEEYLKRSG
jgi:uncharacterized protein